MISCAILDDYQGVATTIADWRPLADKVELKVFREHITDREALAATLSPFEVIVAMRERTPFDAWLFDRLPKLKLLVTTGMRNASIDIASANAHGVTVCGTAGSGGSTAELAWGLILSVLRDIPGEVTRFRQGGAWQTRVGQALHDRTLGVIGLGSLGSRMARVGNAFGMKVLGWSRSLKPERCAELGITHAGSLDALLGGSDIITIHINLNAQSRGMIGAREFGLMRRNAVLINTSRGPIVDQKALVQALTDKRIAGAGVDVYDEEPLPADHPYRRLENLVPTPHLGYVTEESYRVFYGEAVEDVAAWIAGSPVRVLKPAA